jgi:hypothetical protein
LFANAGVQCFQVGKLNTHFISGQPTFQWVNALCNRANGKHTNALDSRDAQSAKKVLGEMVEDFFFGVVHFENVRIFQYGMN